jgi:class 3 adenylate cyclase/CHASE3 domain sensor protein
MFKNLNVQSRLLSALMLISLLGVATASWNIYNVIQIDQHVHDLQDSVDELWNVEEAQVAVLEQEITAKDYLLTGDAYYLNRHSEYSSIMETLLRDSLMFARDSSTTANLTALKGEISQYEELYTALIAPYKPGSVERLITIVGSINTELQRVHDSAETLLHEQMVGIASQVAAVNGLVQVSILIGIFSLGIFSIAAMLAASTTGEVAEPMLHLTNAVVSFENGTYRRVMLEDLMQRRDEIGRLAKAFDAMADSIAESNRSREQLLQAASRFVPYEYLSFLQRDNITEIKLGDHVSAEMAVMFSDVRGFTTMSEGMTPQQNFDFINMYLNRVSPSIRENDGFIVKFLGDGMMAIFPYGVDNAIYSAITKMKEVNKINAERIEAGQPAIDLGIGIHTGHMMVGMIGDEKRMQGDAFSDNVNLTSRVEGLNKFYGTSLIITEEARMRMSAPQEHHMRYMGRVQVKGREQPIALYEIFDGDPQSLREAKISTQDDFARGVEAYRAGQFAEAVSIFEKIKQATPADRAAHLYAQRSREMQAQGTPAQWNGVEVMTSK